MKVHALDPSSPSFDYKPVRALALFVLYRNYWYGVTIRPGYGEYRCNGAFVVSTIQSGYNMVNPR